MTTLSDAVTTPRRVLATRNTSWARRLSRLLAGAAVSPNMVSIAGIAFATVAAVGLAASSRTSDWRAPSLLLAAACIQLRLLCNLLDGMLAMEHGLKTPTGDIFNEVPDRVADAVILIGAGYAVSADGAILGWAAALSAIFTAYVRVFGGSLGTTQSFVGPMAKQHRMFTLTVATLLAVVETTLNLPARAIAWGLVVIIAGSLMTSVRRLRVIAREVASR